MTDDNPPASEVHREALIRAASAVAEAACAYVNRSWGLLAEEDVEAFARLREAVRGWEAITPNRSPDAP